MKDYLVYLAGPITGLTYEGASDWREWVAARFPAYIVAVSPLRGKDYLPRGTALADHYEPALSTTKGITTRDRFDVMRADLILVNFLGATRVSIGTVMEIAWADMLRKPIVVAMEPGNIHEHGMLKESSGFIVPSLEEAIEVIKAVLDPFYEKRFTPQR